MSSIVDEITQTRNGVDAVKIHNCESVPLHREQAVAILLFVFSLAYLCIFRLHCSFEADEGIVLQGAERILRGEVPYRDFFTFYTPGSFYLVAFVLKLFGDTLIAARISLAVSGAACAIITFLLARRVCSLGVALFAGVLATVAGSAYRFLVLHNWYSTFLCGVGLYSAVRFYETRRRFWAFAMGFAAALTFLVEQSKGAGIFLGILLAWIILRSSQRIPSLGRGSIEAALAGFLLPILSTFGYFAVRHSLKIMLQSWAWPLRHYTAANHVPYGWQNWSQDSVDTIFHTGPLWIRTLKVLAVSPGILVPALPLIALGVLVYWTLRMRASTISMEQAGYYVIVCCVSDGLLVSVVAARADVIHFMYLTPLWYVVLAWMIEQSKHSLTWNALRPYFISYVVLAFGLLGTALLLNATGARIQLHTRRGVITSAAQDPALDYLQSHTVPAQQVLVYPYLPLYNYLTATRSPSRYDYFQPGLNTPEQSRQIIASLQSQHSDGVLFEPWFSEKIANSWPGTPLPAIAQDSVSDYIARTYRICKILNSSGGGQFEYMVQRGAVCR